MAQYKSSAAPRRSNEGSSEYLYPDVHTAALALTKNDGLYTSSVIYDSSVDFNSNAAAGETLPFASPVFGDKTASVPGAFAERLRRGLPVIGISVASLAVTGLAAGEPTPAVGFGLFLMLIAGLYAATIRALRP